MQHEAELVYGVKNIPREEGRTPIKFMTHVHWLRGMRGAVSFTWTECLTPEKLPSSVLFLSDPVAVDVGYHRATRAHEWECVTEGCEVLTASASVCFGDGSSMRADGLLKLYEEHGRDETWLREWLAAYYHTEFYDRPDALRDLDSMGLGEVLEKLKKMTTDWEKTTHRDSR